MKSTLLFSAYFLFGISIVTSQSTITDHLSEKYFDQLFIPDTSLVFSQKTSLIKNPRFVWSIGGAYQGSFLFETNVTYSKFKSGWVIVTRGPRIGIESHLSQDNFIYAPKIGYEYNAVLVAFRGSAISYFDHGKPDLRLLPEIGLTLFGLVDLTYGYSFPLSHFRSEAIGRNRIALSINFDAVVFQDL